MMEKYAVSAEEIAPTDDQIRTIHKLREEACCDFGDMPKTASQAEELIKSLMEKTAF